MKSVINFAVILAIATLITACQSNQKSTETDPHATHKSAVADKQSVPQQKEVAQAILKDDKLNAVHQHYIYLTTALINGDLAEAKVAATAIELGAKELRLGSDLIVLASKISTATSIESQRASYAELSNDIIARVKTSGLISGKLYVNYCPMALDDKGARWLSNQTTVKNPYYGNAMLNCGEVAETIK